MVDTGQEDAAAAVTARRYPAGRAPSYGPIRSAPRIGPVPAQADAATAVLAMNRNPEGHTDSNLITVNAISTWANGGARW
jgi:4-hydroxy-2-oxoheptanedioate aldolase